MEGSNIRKIREESDLLRINEEITQTSSFVWDIEKGTQVHSNGLAGILGTDPTQSVTHVQFVETIYEADRKEYLAMVDLVRSGKAKSPTTMEFRIVRKDGLLRNVWVKMIPGFDSKGNLISITGAIQDITERSKQELLTEVIYNISEAAINLSDFITFYQTIQQEISRLVDADNMFVAFYDAVDDTLDIQYITGETDQFKKLPAEGTISRLVIKENCSLLLDQKTLLDLDEQGKIKRIGKSSKTWLGVPLRVHNEAIGVLVVQNYERSNALDEEDQALLEFISIQLVSAIRRMQDSEQIELMRNALQQSPVSVVITDMGGNIEFVNQKFVEVTGFSAEEAIGQNPRILKSGMQTPELYQNLWKTITSGLTWQGEMQNRRKDGTLYWERVAISSIRNIRGENTHFVAMKEDISDRKRMEQDLMDAKDRAEESDRLKTAFLANMSHEVRTPLNGILGFAELLREGDINRQEFNKYIDIINSNGNQLLGIIEDIITVSNLEVKQLKLNRGEFDLVEMIENTRMTMEMERLYLNKTHIQLVFPEFGKPYWLIKTDQRKLQQVLINLLKNALKFTEEGSVQLELDEKPGKILQITVRDTGIGISHDKHTIIFDRFRQVDDSNTRSFGGTGLGLAISKGLVELMGGDIQVESEEGKGSSFSFTLPYN